MGHGLPVDSKRRPIAGQITSDRGFPTTASVRTERCVLRVVTGVLTVRGRVGGVSAKCGIAIHELTHVLGFSSANYQYFINLTRSCHWASNVVHRHGHGYAATACVSLYGGLCMCSQAPTARRQRAADHYADVLSRALTAPPSRALGLKTAAVWGPCLALGEEAVLQRVHER